MKRTSHLRRACWVGLAIIALGSGCTHNYYYGNVPGCPPMVGPTVASQVGSACDVPAGTTVVTSGTPVAGATVTPGQAVAVTPNTQRVVTSLPSYRANITKSLSGWRPPAPESMARTSVDGNVDSTVDR